MISARTLVFLLLTLPLTTSVQATVLKCVDSKGRVTYTNDKNLARNCKPLSGDLPVSSVPSSAPAATSPSPRTSPGTDSNFPRVTPDAQRARDDSRRQILDKELESEQAALNQARETLKAEEERDAPEDRNVARDGKRSINLAKREERLQPLRNAVELHERNIEALQREIARIR